MKLVSYLKDDHGQLAFLIDDVLYDCDRMHPDLPVTMTMFLNYWEDIFPIAHSLHRSLMEGNRKFKGVSFGEVSVLSPVPHPVSFRNFFPGKDGFPEMIFLNHNSFQGAGDIVCMPEHLIKLDLEMQIGIVISKPGKNIPVSEADEYIGGFMIMNNVIAHNLQSNEIQRSGASANGRDFATACGPILVTSDELVEFLLEQEENSKGNVYNLGVKCRVNRKEICNANAAEQKFTFAEIIAQSSYGVQLFPGDVISIGFSPSGNLYSFNEAEKTKDPDFKDVWLKENDIVEIEIEGIGTLVNTIVKEDENL